MNKKIILMGLVFSFLILSITNVSAFVENSEIKTTEIGQIVCHVQDKDAPPGPEPPGLKNIKLVLKNNDETITLEGLTDNKGKYTFVDLQYGDYLITAYGGFGFSNETKSLTLKEPVVYVDFELIKKSRSRNNLNSILLELFQHFPVLVYLINISIKM